MLEDSVKTIRNGEIVQGTVIDVKEDEIILNIGYKADGIITKNEYSNDASLVLTDAVHVGDTMEAKVLKVNDGEGQVTLTYKRLAAEKGNKRLEEAFENQEVLKAPVTQVLDGGLCVNVDEARVFIPASLVSDTYEKDLSKYADQEIEFVITEFNPRRRRIIGNRKQLLLAENVVHARHHEQRHQRGVQQSADAHQRNGLNQRRTGVFRQCRDDQAQNSGETGHQNGPQTGDARVDDVALIELELHHDGLIRRAKLRRFVRTHRRVQRDFFHNVARRRAALAHDVSAFAQRRRNRRAVLSRRHVCNHRIAVFVVFVDIEHNALDGVAVQPVRFNQSNPALRRLVFRFYGIGLHVLPVDGHIHGK